MTPLGSEAGAQPDPGQATALARLAEVQGFAALWARDVPLMVPQRSPADTTAPQASAVDDPFVWLTLLATATSHMAIGLAAAVLPLRHPLHIAKAALSLERVSNGRFVLGLGSGDRPEEFAAFGAVLEQRAQVFRERWPLLRAALSPDAQERALMLQQVGYPVLPAPAARIPMLVVGSARQSLQWIAEHADGWATYHREEATQEGRIGLWQHAMRQKLGSARKPFVQSAQLQLLEDPAAPATPLELGLRGGSAAVRDYLQRMHVLGVDHVMFNLSGGRPAAEVIEQIGAEIIPALSAQPSG
ncbi:MULTISPECIES: TIGR03571 family LLM class oxidoreductase [unclassified Stenotrophomonas]|uniref:TIGR03571 family LLM class oxidoreductase n=1 Tax=unclassified Stenotrophomonas TaxID=196198 RepID=UPI001E374C7E|nr:MULTISPECIES: TIGR03571 family LLM class oxidoreductase [unclassified Stenotrophomonas]